MKRKSRDWQKSNSTYVTT